MGCLTQSYREDWPARRLLAVLLHLALRFECQKRVAKLLTRLTTLTSKHTHTYSREHTHMRRTPTTRTHPWQAQVLNGGTIKLVNARHPVLLLRGKAPVGNDMSLDGSMQALILTGPNAGRRG